jgi:hypothetical protein
MQFKGGASPLYGLYSLYGLPAVRDPHSSITCIREDSVVPTHKTRLLQAKYRESAHPYYLHR